MADSAPRSKPKLTRQLSSNSLALLGEVFEKMGGDKKGVAPKKTAVGYYCKVAVEGGLEEMAMIIDEIEGDTITFKQFIGLFTAWSLPDEQMEGLLAKVKFVAKEERKSAAGRTKAAASSEKGVAASSEKGVAASS